MRTWRGLKLVIVHYHFRPGGVRRVIELATPHLCRMVRPGVTRVVLAGGEAPDDTWWRQFRGSLRPVHAECRTEPSLAYFAEQEQRRDGGVERLREFLRDLVGMGGTEPCLIWAHNQGLGRNLLLTSELQQAVRRTRHCRLVFHHHDWWFDNRWQRWPEMRQAGFATVAQVARSIFPATDAIRHIAINQADSAILERHFPGQSAWVPNPAPESVGPTARGRSRARKWIAGELGDGAPVWLMPCRLLRRKNIGEALLLTRWLRPEAWLVTTAGVSSAEERVYAERLAAAAGRNHWRLRLGILRRQEASSPALPDLLGACEVLLLTSLQEGFGLPYLEAATARRPLIARSLSNVAPDLAGFGLRFPHSYPDLFIDLALFNWRAERRRQARLYHRWRTTLPAPYRQFAGTPALLETDSRPGPIAFSRLTLTAQLEVLSCPAKEAWDGCAPLNPWLGGWRELASGRKLQLASWPRAAQRGLSGPALARRFCQVLKWAPRSALKPHASGAAQEEFVQNRLRAENLYPLTWSPDT